MTHYLYAYGKTIEAETEDQIRHFAETIEYLTDFSGIGHVTAANLIEHFGGDLESILEASEEELLAVDGVGPRNSENLVDRISNEEDKIRRISERHSPTLDELEEDDLFDMRVAEGE